MGSRLPAAPVRRWSVRRRALSAVVVVALVALFAVLPGAARSQSPPTTPTASPPSTPGEATPSPGTSPSPTTTPVAGPTATPTPGAVAPPAVPAAPPEGATTDTEYLKVQISKTGAPMGAWLKDWIRLRGRGQRTIIDPGVFASVRSLHGGPDPAVGKDGVAWKLKIPDVGYRDLYYEGRLIQAGDFWETPDGLKPLPVFVRIRYFSGEEGAEEEVPPQVLETTNQPLRFKIVIELTNMTKREEEVRYTDIQTKRDVVAVGPVYTPYVARIVDLTLPDSSYDQIRTDGVATRAGRSTVINWERNLVPPDFPATQTGIVTGIIARGSKLPAIKIVAQPVFPPMEAEPLTTQGVQFERGRRSFFYDVFNLFRDNLVALTGLFGLLHDSFANLAIPILGPEKGNREAGTFDRPNQLWALWTLTKGIEQLDRAMNTITNSVEIARNGVKGALATLTAIRLLVGFSTDRALVSSSGIDADALLENSIWGDLKTALATCGETSFSSDDRPYLPETPLLTTPLCAGAAVPLNIALLKLSIAEHLMHTIQKENHALDTANLGGPAPLPPASGSPLCSPGESKDTPKGQTCGSYDKYLFIKFPFGLEEIERGLYTVKTKGFDPLQAAIGNVDTPNSLIWALHVLTNGAESQLDSFHQLGATWRYISDSIMNFGIFGVETSRSLLQWDVNSIDINTAIKAAAVARARKLATFMGRPAGSKRSPTIGQLVLTFSTERVSERPMATESAAGKAGVVVASGLVLMTLVGFARFRWFII
jgi:hypothetical protein